MEEALVGEEGAALAADRVAALVGLDGSEASAEEGFWGMRKLLEALARRRPLVVVFDDVHWGEPTFLDLVEHVADWAREAPVFSYCSPVRTSWTRARDGAAASANATSILLEALSEGESQTDRQPRRRADGVGEVAGRIDEAAEGNPLFVEEMLLVLIDSRAPVRRGERWVGRRRDLSEVTVPESIERFSPPGSTSSTRTSVRRSSVRPSKGRCSIAARSNRRRARLLNSRSRSIESLSGRS